MKMISVFIVVLPLIASNIAYSDTGSQYCVRKYKNFKTCIPITNRVGVTIRVTLGGFFTNASLTNNLTKSGINKNTIYNRVRATVYLGDIILWNNKEVRNLIGLKCTTSGCKEWE